MPLDMRTARCTVAADRRQLVRHHRTFAVRADVRGDAIAVPAAWTDGHRPMVPMIAFLLLYNIGGIMAVIPHLINPDMVQFTAVSCYMAVMGLFFAFASAKTRSKSCPVVIATATSLRRPSRYSRVSSAIWTLAVCRNS